MGKQTPEYKKKHQEQKTVLGMRGKAEPAEGLGSNINSADEKLL